MEKIEEYIKENNAATFTNVGDLWTDAQVKLKNFLIKSKTNESLTEKFNYALKGCFILTGKYEFTTLSSSQLDEIRISDGNLNSIQVQVDSTKVQSLIPIFSYATYGKKFMETNFSDPNFSKKYIPYNFGLYLVFAVNDGVAEGQIILEFAEELHPNTDPDPRVFDILKEKPFLIGFVGIKNRYIPIVVDDESVLENLHLKTYTLSISGSLKETLITKVDIRNFERKPMTLDVPLILFKDKVFYAFRNVPKELLEIISSPTVKVGRYKFDNNTHLGIVIIRNIAEYIKNNTLKDFSPLSSYITYDMTEDYKNDIKLLSESFPIDQKDLVKSGLSPETLNIYLRLSGILLSNRYRITKDILTAVYSILKNGVNAFINETDHDIVRQDVERILSVIGFYYEYIDESKNIPDEYKKIYNISDVIKNLVINRQKVHREQYKNKLKSIFRISEQDSLNIIENMINGGYIEFLDETNELMLTEEVIKQVLGE